MSVVKRPGRFSAFDPTQIYSEGTQQPPSREAVIKSEATKRYLEQYWNKVNQRYLSREERLRMLQENLEESELTEEQKQEIVADFLKEENEFTRYSRTKLKPENYNFIKLIGRGGFADVWLVTNKKTQDINALKIIRKRDVILSDQVEAVRNERNILAIAKNPWIVKLFCSFQDEDHLYLVLEFVQGGDLMNALVKCKFFPPSVARFFCGEIALALHSVHELGFVHSDLKPDNVLISLSGHIKLTDFGIASQYGKGDKEFTDLLASAQGLMLDSSQPILSTAGVKKHRQRNSIIGSIDYTAPEVLRGGQRTFKSDWWSFGIILYEMIYGFTPFASNSKNETVLRIVNWKKALRIPAGQRVPIQVLDLLKHLLCDEEERYGFKEIIAHPFFAGFDFNDPFSQKTPIKPNVSDPLDTAHFDSFENVKKEDLRASASLSKLADFVFHGFSYKAKPPSSTLAKFGIET